MRILILGTSNSILKEGWIAGLRLSLPFAEITNKSIGGSPGTQFGWAVLEDLSSFDYVILDSIPNDERSDPPDVLQFTNRIIFEIMSSVSASTRCIVLGFTNRVNLDTESEIFRSRRDMAAAAGAQFIDVRALVIAYGQKILGDLPLYEHTAHPHRDFSRAVGFELGSLLDIDSWPAAVVTPDHYRSNFEIIDLASLTPAASRVRIKNRLVDIECARIQGGQALEIPNSNVCFGIFVEKFSTNAVLWIIGANQKYQMNLINQAERPATELGFYQIARGMRVDRLEVRGEPDTSVAVLWRALFWLGNKTIPLPAKDVEPALRLHDSLLSRLSNHASIWSEVIHLFRKAKILNKDGKKQEAFEALERSAALFPPHAELLFDLGRAHAQMRNFEKAVECFDRSLLLQPGDVPCLHDKARSLMQLRLYAEAIESLTEASRRHPEKAGLADDLAKARALAIRAEATESKS